MSDDVTTKVEAIELSRWRKWSWESECVYGEEEVIPAVFMELFQKVTQKYRRRERAGGLSSSSSKSFSLKNQICSCEEMLWWWSGYTKTQPKVQRCL